MATALKNRDLIAQIIGHRVVAVRRSPPHPEAVVRPEDLGLRNAMLIPRSEAD